ncbi:hypothetical protein ACOMHN_018273 [Nucella lapillus]
MYKTPREKDASLEIGGLLSPQNREKEISFRCYFSVGALRAYSLRQSRYLFRDPFNRSMPLTVAPTSPTSDPRPVNLLNGFSTVSGNLQDVYPVLLRCTPNPHSVDFVNFPHKTVMLNLRCYVRATIELHWDWISKGAENGSLYSKVEKKHITNGVPLPAERCTSNWITTLLLPVSVQDRNRQFRITALYKGGQSRTTTFTLRDTSDREATPLDNNLNLQDFQTALTITGWVILSFVLMVIVCLLRMLSFLILRQLAHALYPRLQNWHIPGRHFTVMRLRQLRTFLMQMAILRRRSGQQGGTEHQQPDAARQQQAPGEEAGTATDQDPGIQGQNTGLDSNVDEPNGTNGAINASLPESSMDNCDIVGAEDDVTTCSMKSTNADLEDVNIGITSPTENDSGVPAQNDSGVIGVSATGGGEAGSSLVPCVVEDRLSVGSSARGASSPGSRTPTDTPQDSQGR